MPLKLWPLLLAGITLMSSVLALAQSGKISGWVRPVRSYDAAQKGDLPKINLPQPQWTKVPDIQSSDGTSNIPSCDDSDVVASVKEGILAALNRPFAATARGGGFGQMFNKIDMETIWVHPSWSGRFVCDTQVSVPEMPLIKADHWKFQTFSQDGKVLVFFYDADDQNSR